MFTSKNKLHNPLEGKKSSVPSIISSDVFLEGDVRSTGVVQIEGRIFGNLCSGEVILREVGYVKGNITAEKVQIDGKVDGCVTGKNVRLSSTAHISGTISYETLSISDGATLNGDCKRASNLALKELQKISEAIESDVSPEESLKLVSDNA